MPSMPINDSAITLLKGRMSTPHELISEATRVVSGDRHNRSSDSSSVFGSSMCSSTKLPTPSVALDSSAHTTAPQYLRVKIQNELSQRFKDLVVALSDDSTIFDAIYDQSSVKDAHVRKWDKDVAQQVKAGKRNIQLAVWDEILNRPCHSFTVEELKETTLQTLFEVMPAGDHVKLVLQCVPAHNSTTHGNTTHASVSSPPLRCPFSGVQVQSKALDTFKEQARLKQNEIRRKVNAQDREDEAQAEDDLASDVEDKQKCRDDNASWKTKKTLPDVIQVRVTNEKSYISRDLLVPMGDTFFMYSAVYDHTGLMDALVNKWDDATQHAIDTGILEVHLALCSYGKTCRRFSPDELTSLSVTNFFHICTSYGLKTNEIFDLQLQCVPPSKNEHPRTRSNSIHSFNVPLEIGVGSLRKSSIGHNSIMETDDSITMGSVLLTPQVIRIRVTNRSTHIYKNLVLQVSSSINLRDSVYDANSVKEANVRKWGPKETADIKAGIAEIRIVVWDEIAARPSISLAVEDLKAFSTQDLYNLMAGEEEDFSDMVRIFLECLHVNNTKSSSSPLRQSSLSITQPIPSLRIEKGKPQSSTLATLAHSKSESCLKRPTRRRRNHMLYQSNASINSNESSKESRLQTIEDDETDAHGQPTIANRLPRRKTKNKFDIDSFLVNTRGKIKKGGIMARSRSTDFLTTNAEWKSLPSKVSQNGLLLSEKVSRFMALSKSESKASQSSDDIKNMDPDTGKVKEFLQLYNAKNAASDVRGIQNESQDSTSQRNAKFPTMVQTNTARENLFMSRVSSITLNHEGRSLGVQHPEPNANFPKSSNLQNTSIQPKDPNVSDRINRFLRFSQEQQVPLKAASSQNAFRGLKSSLSTNSLKKSGSLASVQESGNPRNAKMKLSTVPAMKKFDVQRKADIPPIAEIEVVKSDHDARANTGGIGLSADVVKQIFPYHVVIDSNFQIVQVGEMLSRLTVEEVMLGRIVSEILMITSPIPMFREWDWKILEKMKDKTVFFESVASDSLGQKIRGTIIEISSTPKMIMLALHPDAKNLSELHEMGLTMSDLPLHSCQREAVLLGEHSRSEVNLTNHLDQLHRDLIETMERQIEERTTELETANEDLAGANHQLAMQSARQLEHFACMSHEIRTPLNCIVGMSSLLLDDASEMDPMHADSIRMINTSGDLLKAVVDDVLDYAKLESGSFEVDIKQTNLQDTLASVVHSISQKVLEKNIRLRTHYSATLPLFLQTDSRRLQQVLFNLLGNAGKFSKPNSVIDLSVIMMEGALPVPEEYAGEYPPSGRIIRFSVKDYGKGIEKKDFQTIFEPFSQASKETQNVYGGTGLGLSITSKLVHRLGGALGLDSEPGNFTEFTVDLPFHGDEVDVDHIRSQFSDCTLVLIEPSKTYDYSFTDYKILPEPEPFDNIVKAIYGLHVLRYDTVEDAICSSGKLYDESDHHFIYLIQEDLFYLGIIERLKGMMQSNFTCVTFGPNYSVGLTKDWHMKSLVGFFPTALLHNLSRSIQSQASVWHKSIEENNQSKDGKFSAFGSASSDCATNEYRKESNQGEKNDNNLRQAHGNTREMEKSGSGFLTALNDAAPSLTKTVYKPLRSSGTFSHLKLQNVNVIRRSSHESSSVLDRSQMRGIENGLFASLKSDRSLTPPPPPPPQRSHSNKMSPTPVNGLFAKLDAIEASRNSEDRVTPSRTLSSNSGGPMFCPSGQNAVKRIPAKRDLKILYCEDNKVNQKVLSRHLTKAGVEEVVVVENGKLGVEACEKQSFDVIFMDYEMPVMNGMEATKLIMKKDPSAVVIFVTAHALEEFKTKAESVGASGFFSKPFRAQDIEAVLDRISGSKTKKSEKTTQSEAPERKVQSLKVPISSENRVENFKKQGVSSIQPRNLKILVAEDNAINQKLMVRVLNRAGVTDITLVDNGAKALELTKKAAFNCILSDVEMPVMDGLMACRMIVKNNPSAKVVLVTAHTNFETKAKAVGAWDTLPKPFKLEDVKLLLDRVEAKAVLHRNEKELQEAKIDDHDESSKSNSEKSSTSNSNSRPRKKIITNSSPLKVLYAEDNIVNQKVLSKVLNRAGIGDITVVDNGQKAVDICEKVKFDVIFMDMQMPVLDGMEACRQIVDRDPSAVVIFVTAHALDEFKNQARKTGAKNFISKPFRLDDIKTVLKELK